MQIVPLHVRVDNPSQRKVQCGKIQVAHNAAQINKLVDLFKEPKKADRPVYHPVSSIQQTKYPVYNPDSLLVVVKPFNSGGGLAICSRLQTD